MQSSASNLDPNPFSSRFHGEETYNPAHRLTEAPTFIVDPIDGTVNFVHGFPYACVSLGFAINRIPTVGVVVDPVHIPLDTPALQALVRANQRALRTLAEQPGRAVDYVAWFLDRLTRDEAQQYYERYIGPYFIPGRQVDLNVAQQSIDAVAGELGLTSVPADAIYGPSA